MVLFVCEEVILGNQRPHWYKHRRREQVVYREWQTIWWFSSGSGFNSGQAL